MTEKVIAYIDGFNLYFGMKSRGWSRYYWLDPSALITRMLGSNQSLECVRYFTSRIKGNPDKQKRQSTYLEALGLLPKLTIHYGRYQLDEVTCPNCGTSYQTPHEKMTDVNIVVELMRDAKAGLFDVAFLLSADADLLPGLVALKSEYPGKRAVVVFPPDRQSFHLRNKADGALHVSEAALRASQLPDRITKPDGFVLERPAGWK